MIDRLIDWFQCERYQPALLDPLYCIVLRSLESYDGYLVYSSMLGD